MSGDGPSSGFLIHGNRLKKGRPSQRGNGVHSPGGPECSPGGPKIQEFGTVEEAPVGIKGKRGRPREAPQAKDAKRGQAAWANLRQAALSAREAGERMLIHTVSDSTALNCYIPALRKLVAFAEDNSLADGNSALIDKGVLQYLGHCCYMEEQHPHQGGLVVSALCYVWPDVATALPNAWRASKGWNKFAVTLEGQPVAPQRLAVMQEELRAHGSATAAEAADAIAIAADGYLREQDLFQLRVQDVILHRGTATLLLGVSSRGESAKTGRDQGVVLDEPFSYEILHRRCSNLNQGDKVFPRLSALTYTKWWRWAAKQACGDSNGAGKPHSARHSGPSKDLTTGYRSLEAIMKRGRWKALTSIHRYAKPHAYYACLAKLSPEERARGDAILEGRAPRPDVAAT